MRRIREADLRGHFTHGDASSTQESGSGEDSTADEDSHSSNDDSDEELAVEEGEGDGNGAQEVGDLDEDVMLARAVEVLKSWTYFDGLSKRRSAAAPANEVPEEASQKEALPTEAAPKEVSPKDEP